MMFLILKILLSICSLSLVVLVVETIFSGFGIAKNIDKMTAEDYVLLCAQVERCEGVKLPLTIQEFKKEFIASRLSQIAILTFIQIPVLWGLISL